MLETGQNLNTPDVGRSLFPANNDAMVHHLVDHLDGWSRNALLGISNSIKLAEITVNQMPLFYWGPHFSEALQTDPPLN